MTKPKTICDRCGTDIGNGIGKIYSRLFKHIITNDYGEKVTLWLCWDCDFDVINGGDPFADESEVFLDRWENDYAYDPINTPPPPR